MDSITECLSDQEHVPDLLLDLPDGIKDILPLVAPCALFRGVCQRWRRLVEEDDEIWWMLRWRGHVLESGPGPAEWKHRTDVEMGVFFEQRCYDFKFHPDRKYSVKWTRQCAADYFSEAMVDDGTHYVHGHNLILRSSSMQVAIPVCEALRKFSQSSRPASWETHFLNLTYKLTGLMAPFSFTGQEQATAFNPFAPLPIQRR